MKTIETSLEDRLPRFVKRFPEFPARRYLELMDNFRSIVLSFDIGLLSEDEFIRYAIDDEFDELYQLTQKLGVLNRSENKT